MLKEKATRASVWCYGPLRMGNQQRCPDNEGSVQRPHGAGSEAELRYSLLPCESMGIKDYDGPGTATTRVKLTQGGSNWYSPGGVSYVASYAAQYRNTLYRRDWNADDGYYYTQVSGPFYVNYRRSYLSFANEYDNGSTLYDSTTITASATVSGGTEKTVTVLARSGSTAMQNFAFDMEE